MNASPCQAPYTNWQLRDHTFTYDYSSDTTIKDCWMGIAKVLVGSRGITVDVLAVVINFAALPRGKCLIWQIPHLSFAFK